MLNLQAQLKEYILHTVYKKYNTLHISCTVYIVQRIGYFILNIYKYWIKTLQ